MVRKLSSHADGPAAAPERAVQAPPAPTRAPSAATIQAKLTVGAVDDRYEREADRMAVAVMRAINGSPPPGATDAAPTGNTAQRRVQRAPAAPTIGLEGGDVDADTSSRIQRARSGGSPLDDSLRRTMEGGFGADFSRVRVHTDSTANGLSERIQAKAFTTGSDIFFSKGAYSPDTSQGQKLVAHELTHTIQQGAAAPAQRAQREVELPISGTSDPAGRIQRKEGQKVSAVTLTPGGERNDYKGTEELVFDERSPEYLAQLKFDAANAQAKLISAFKHLEELDSVAFSYQKGPLKNTEDPLTDFNPNPDPNQKKTPLSPALADQAFPTKAKERILDKAGTKYKGDFSQFTDISRASLIFDNPKTLIESQTLLKEIFSASGMKVVRQNNRFDKEGTEDDHYRDFLVNLSVPLGDIEHIVELQLHLKPMMAAKSARKKEIQDPNYTALNKSASRLLKLNGTKDSKDKTISFPEKALHSVREISAADSPSTIDGGEGLSGHHLYNVKRYLFENHEISLKSEWKIWSKVAADDFYDAAWKKDVLGKEPSSEIAILQKLSFT
jgi:hypothetical protein